MRCHRLRIALANIEPPIWRRVDVPSHANLEELHRVIQAAMGWLDCHLHGFVIDGQPYQLPEEGRFQEPGTVDERAFHLGALRAGTRFTYTYDFGDDWEHEILVEGVHDLDQDLALCVDGARACPPEDCGGPGGYLDLLEALGNVGHERHREMRDWVGGQLAPEAFQLQMANAALVALYRDPPAPPAPARRSRKRR